MGHVWTWLESRGEVFSESEKSSSGQSSWSSLDSHLDLELELGNWREVEETTEEDLEGSSSRQEEDSQSETGDPAVYENVSTKDMEGTGRDKQEAVLQFLSEVTHLIEPLCIGSTNLSQGPQVLGTAWENNGKGDLTHEEHADKSPAHTEEEVGEESHFQIFRKQDMANILPQKKGNWPFQVSKGISVINWQADEMEELEDLFEQSEASQIQNSKFDHNLGKKVLHILEESTGEMEDEDFSSGCMNQTSCSWETGKEEISQSVKKEVAIEDTEEQAEDWKYSDFHLSYSNDDASPWGTPLTSSPSTSTASLPLMQLSQDDSLQQRLLFRKTLLSIWKMVASHRYSGPFLKAVSEKQAPGYKDVVKRPVDLSSIKRSLSKGEIQNMIQFQRDLMLMFQNAVMYNSSNHHIHRIAVQMQQEVLEQLQMLGEALLCSGEIEGFLRWC